MKNYIFALVLFFSNMIFSQEKSNLEYNEDIYSIKIEMESGQNYLELEKDNQFKFILQNIDPTKFRASAHNLRIHKAGENKVIIWVAKPKTEKLKDGKYALAISFSDEKGKLHTHQFLIDVK